MMTRRTVLAALTLPLFLLVLGSCEDHIPTKLERVHQVVVIPVTAILNEPGDQVQLGASVRDQVGGAILGMELEWTSSAPTVATVDDTGLVTAVGTGNTLIKVQVVGTTVEEQSAIIVR
jgi:hypothetical protein